MAKKIVSDLKVEGKKVLIRVDFNVPMKDGVITDDTRIRAALPTIEYVINHGGKAIVFSHLGRVKEEADLAKNDLTPVAKRLEELIKKPVHFVNATKGKALEEAASQLGNGEILMFQNTRYEDLEGKKESKNDTELGKY
ncbi:MAG TPA: phosphoglycerate kinase, partial [Candidatus Pelethenecus sp.]|nr:phosphoglycerate kinase [Candidatus Pelethenecus sp.]